MIRRMMWLAPTLALALAGCGAREILTGIATVGGAAMGAGAGQTAAAPIAMEEGRLDDKTKLAKSEGSRMADYFESGKLPTSISPDTAHPMFCPMVIAQLAQIAPGDDGGLALALGCQIRYQLGKAKDAFEDRNPTAYNDHLGKADGFIGQLTNILDRHKGISQ